MLDITAHHQHMHGVEDIMLAWETSLETLEMRRRFDDDGDEYEDGFQFDDEDEDDEDLDDDELDDEEDEEDEDEDDFSFGNDEDEE
jgi:hypothetical protein